MIVVVVMARHTPGVMLMYNSALSQMSDAAARSAGVHTNDIVKLFTRWKRTGPNAVTRAVVVGFLAALAIGATAGSAAAQGRRHALLIGVGDYEHVRDLEGPPNDVASLARALQQEWRFEPANVTTLVDRAATREAILAALDDLIERTQAGDYVFIFFSGHGTSSLNAASQSVLEAGLDPGTGGLFPADLDVNADDAFERLIVGRRDLRPRLLELDRGREVLVVFDACFSGNSVRSGFALGEPKGEAWTSDLPPTAFGSQTAVQEAYPYENLQYLSASSEQEYAYDIPTKFLDVKPTIDGEPHGALADALLRGLKGEANTNRDDELTVRELHAYVRRFVSGRFGQTPQLLHPEGQFDLPDRPVFRTRMDATPAPIVAPTTLRVFIDENARALREPIGQLEGVQLVDGAHDVRIVAEGDQFTLLHGSDDAIIGPVDAAVIVQRVDRERYIRELRELTFADQAFNVQLNVPNRFGEFQVGDAFELQYGADVDAYFLLLNVDKEGVVHVLAPWDEDDLQPGRGRSIPDIRITAPAGTEFLKLFGFARRPAELDDWAPTLTVDGTRRPIRIVPESARLNDLLEFVRLAASSAAETTAKIVTQPRQ